MSALHSFHIRTLDQDRIPVPDHIPAPAHTLDLRVRLLDLPARLLVLAPAEWMAVTKLTMAVILPEVRRLSRSSALVATWSTCISGITGISGTDVEHVIRAVLT